MDEDKMMKVAYCLCGEKYIAAGILEAIESDKEIMLSYVKYAKMGRRIAYEKQSEWKGFCNEETCEKAQKILHPDKFFQSKNQLKIENI